jgi:hypothetical protein
VLEERIVVAAEPVPLVGADRAEPVYDLDGDAGKISSRGPTSR